MIEGAVCQCVADAAPEIKAIVKEKLNKQQNYPFRGIDDVYNSIQPILAKHRIFMLPEVLEDRTEERQTKAGSNLIYRVLKIKYTIYCYDGSSISGVVIGEGMDSGDKAANKAMAVGHKYFILQAFCIPTEDMPDPDAESHEVRGRRTTPTTKQLPTPPPKKKQSFPEVMAEMKAKLGDEVFGNILDDHGVIENEIATLTDREVMKTIFNVMSERVAASN